MRVNCDKEYRREFSRSMLGEISTGEQTRRSPSSEIDEMEVRAIQKFEREMLRGTLDFVRYDPLLEENI
jgi:hypothetical protein